MNQFVQYAPTEVIFGTGTEGQTGEAVRRWGGSRVFVLYGGGSVVRSGLLDRVTASLEDAGVAYELCGGVKPNPRLAFAEEAVEKARAFDADFVLAVGGGSTIDTAKATAHGLANPDAKLWDIWTGAYKLERSTPVGVVLTIPAAGSEMSDSAVLTNEEIERKTGLSTPFNRCKFAVMNPELALTLPDYQLACGVCDIMMHTMERYFIAGAKCDMTDEIAEGLLRTVIANGEQAMKDRDDVEAMAEVMWASSLSHNGLTGCGRSGRDFSVHKLGQAIGAKYDYAHGATLSAVWGAWADALYRDEPGRFSRYARKVWGIAEEDDLAAAEAGIKATVDFFARLGLPVTLSDFGRSFSDEELEALAWEATRGDTIKLTQIKPVGYAEVLEMFRAANR